MTITATATTMSIVTNAITSSSHKLDVVSLTVPATITAAQQKFDFISQFLLQLLLKYACMLDILILQFVYMDYCDGTLPILQKL